MPPASSAYQYAPDTADTIRMQLGTSAEPQDLTGATVEIVTRNPSTGVRTAVAATIEDPATAGIVSRARTEAERPEAGATLAVEAVVTFDGGGIRTYPGPDEPRLLLHVPPRRTGAEP